MSQAINHTTPVGRLVRGSLYKANDKDAEGKPLVVKSGPQQGQPRLDYFFAVAIPKGPEQHWAQTEWGAKLWQVGSTAFPQACQSPTFAWKVTDGDSQIPNKKGKKPCDNEGYRGHWVLHFSSGYPPNLYQIQNGQPVPFNEPDAIKLGYFVQVNFNCAGNGSQSQPGIYLNHRMICFIAYGQEIVVGPDVASAGFGGAALPAGATMTPPAGAFGAMAATPGAMPGAPALPGAPVAPLIPGMASPAAFPPPGMPAPMAAPVAPAAPMPPAAPAAPVDPLVGVPGAPHTVAQLRAAGWSDDQIVAGGYATRAAAAAAPLPPTTSAPALAAPAAPIAHAPTAVTPNPGFVQAPGVPAVPGAPAAPVAARLVMTAAANGQTYEAFRAAGWSDDQIVAGGFAVRAA